MVRRSAWLVVGIVLVLASVALAQAQDPREIEARKDCLTGKYEAGTALLAELFAETGNPNFVYNQARCFEQNAKPDEAIQRFREYLRIAGTLSADEKAAVDGHIAECRAMKAEQEQQRAAAPVEPAVPSPVVVPQSGPWSEPGGPLPAADTATSMDRTVAVSAEGSGAVLRRWGIVTGSIGVAAVGSGVVFSLLTRSTQQQVESDAGNRFFDPNKDARGRLYETLQWVGYGVGAAAIAAGGIMYFFGRGVSQHDSVQPVALVPAVGPRQGGLVLQGRF